MNSYSQQGEDKVVSEIFGEDYKGVLLEIGAWSATIFSNSRAFIENGWDAVLVEFSPNPVHSLVNFYGYNSRVKILQAAITPDEQPALEFDITEDALSTRNHDLKQRWADASVNYYGKLWVPTLSISNLLEQFFSKQAPDYISIDTEGSSVDLALALFATEYRPRVLVVEFDNSLELLTEEALNQRYCVAHKNDTNVIFEHA